MTLTLIISFAASAFLLNLAPGPSILYVMSQSIVSGRKVGVASAFGLATGSAAWAVLTAFGVSALIATSTTAFTMLRYVGAAYLVYLAVSGLRSSPFRIREDKTLPRSTLIQGYFRGFLVEGTNPKTVTFFVALVPQIVATLGGASIWEVALFCMIVPATALPIDLAVGWSGGTVAKRIANRPKVGKILNYVSSAILISLAGLVLVN